MAAKYIHLHHHVDSFECFWNGIEDIYMTETGEEIPDCFFFTLSGLGEFSYEISESQPIKRQALWNTIYIKQMYKHLGPVAGFEFEFYECTDFDYMLRQAKHSIDKGNPVVVGALDMFCLNYHIKFWQIDHITCHYIMMIGYNDADKSIYLYDNLFQEVQELSYESLKSALEIEKSKCIEPCGMYSIKFKSKLPDVKQLSIQAFKDKAERMLQSSKESVGINAMYRLSRDFIDWKEQMNENDFRKCLLNIVQYTGITTFADTIVPLERRMKLPSYASRDVIAGNLSNLAARYDLKSFNLAAEQFERSGKWISQMTGILTDYLLDKSDELAKIPGMIEHIAKTEETAYTFLV